MRGELWNLEQKQELSAYKEYSELIPEIAYYGSIVAMGGFAYKEYSREK